MSFQPAEITSSVIKDDSTSFTPNSGYIYWTDVAWGFVESNVWQPSCLWKTGSLYGYRYWLTITTRDYEPNWLNYLYDWYINVLNFPDISPSERISDRNRVRRDSMIYWPDHHLIETGYVFESCYYRTGVRLRIGRRVYMKNGHFHHYYVTPPHRVNVRPI